MKICLFGNFDRTYSRNRVIERGLRESGVEVVLCHSAARGVRAVRELMRAHRAHTGSYDALLVAYSDDRFLVPLARLLSRKPVVWDAFYSRFDTLAFDRKLIRPWGIKALYHWSADWLSARLAHTILLDTNTHIERFCTLLSVSKEKCVRVLVGAEDLAGAHGNKTD